MRVLIVCIAPQWIASLIQLAKGIDGTGRFRFLIAHPPGLDPAKSGLIRESGFDSAAIGHVFASSPAPAWSKRFRLAYRIAERIGRTAKRTSFMQILMEKRLLSKLRALYPEASKLLGDWKPDIVLTFGDRHGGMEACLLKAARSSGVPIVIPYMAYSDREGAIDMRRGNSLFRTSLFSPLYYKWAFRRYRAQVHDRMLFYMPFEARAYEKFGTLPTNGWTMGTGISDYVCVDGKHSQDRYLSYGVRAEKIRVLGDVSSDRLFEAYSRRLEIARDIRSKYNLNGDAPIILVSLPHLAEHDLLPWDRHFEEIEFLMGSLAALRRNLLISLHPKMDRNRYAYLEAKYGCRILDERLFEVLPGMDLFVATLSSTVMWAILCGVKPVVLNYFGLESQFGFLTSIRLVDTREQLPEALREKLASRADDFSDDWRQLSRESVFDGNTIERYRSLFAECGTRRRNAK